MPRFRRFPRSPILSAIALALLVAGGMLPPLQGAEPAGGWTARTVAGTGEKGHSGDSGPALRARLDNPFGVTRGPDGALYVVEFDGNVVRRIAADGTITTVAGSGRKGGAGDGGPALEAEFDQPHEIRFDRHGHLFIADMLNHRIRKVDAKTRIVSTVAGTGRPGFDGDGGPASRASLHHPIALQFDAAGDLFVCDIGNHRVRRIDTTTGRIDTVAGSGMRGTPEDGAPFASAPFHGPRTLDFDARGDLWLALREGNQVWRLDRKAGTARLIAGTGQKGMGGNGGPARRATLSGPKGLSVGPDGRVYVADTESHSIRVIDPVAGTIDAVAGDGTRGDGPAGRGTACRLARPHGVFTDRDGSVFVGDSENHQVRRLQPAP